MNSCSINTNDPVMLVKLHARRAFLTPKVILKVDKMPVRVTAWFDFFIYILRGSHFQI